MLPNRIRFKSYLRWFLLCLLFFTQLTFAANVVGYCTGDKCPPKPPGTINNEYPHPICLKEYYCAGTYNQKVIANLCGCCGCNGGSCGCAGGSIVCCDGTLSQVCGCNFRLVE